MTENVNVTLYYVTLFGACFVSKMEDKAGSVYPDVRESLDNIKMEGVYLQILIKRLSVI